MNIIDDEKSLLALEYKQLHDIEPRTPKISKRLNEIMTYFINQYEPFLFRKLTGVPVCDRNIIESTFRYELLYGLLHWKGKSPFGGYLALCLKSVIRQYLIEKSPVHRQDITGGISYELLSESLSDKEDSLGDDFKTNDIDIEDLIDEISTDDID